MNSHVVLPVARRRLANLNSHGINRGRAGGRAAVQRHPGTPARLSDRLPAGSRRTRAQSAARPPAARPPAPGPTRLPACPPVCLPNRSPARLLLRGTAHPLARPSVSSRVRRMQGILSWIQFVGQETMKCDRSVKAHYLPTQCRVDGLVSPVINIKYYCFATRKSSARPKLRSMC